MEQRIEDVGERARLENPNSLITDRETRLKDGTLSFSLKQQMWQHYHEKVVKYSRRDFGEYKEIVNSDDKSARLKAIRARVLSHLKLYPSFIDYDRKMYEACLIQSVNLMCGLELVKREPIISHFEDYKAATENLDILITMAETPNYTNSWGKFFLKVAALCFLISLVFFHAALFAAGLQILTCLAYLLPVNIIGIGVISPQLWTLPDFGALLVITLACGLGCLYQNPSPQGSKELAKDMRIFKQLCDKECKPEYEKFQEKGTVELQKSTDENSIQMKV